MYGLLILLAIGFLLALSGAIGYTMWVLTHPPRRTYASAVAKGRAGDPGELSPQLAFESWSFASRGRELPVWDVPGQRPDGPVVVLVHGWGDSRIGALVRIPALLPACSRIVAFDLPGHGEAPGICELGTREGEDVEALLAAMDDDRVVLYGWSLGAGVALEVAGGEARRHEGTEARRGGAERRRDGETERRSEGRVAGVIAEAPYRLAPTPARNVLRAKRLPYRLNLAPAYWLLNLVFGGRLAAKRFDRAQHAAQLGCPLLVLHGEDDEICPVEDGQAIGAAAEGEIAVIAGGDHNGLWTEEGSGEACEAAVRGFLERIG